MKDEEIKDKVRKNLKKAFENPIKMNVNFGMKDKIFNHNTYMRKEMGKGGKFYHIQKARTEAIKILIRKYKKEFDKIYNKLKEEMKEEELKNDK
jgi:hypothetical protein